VIKESSENVQKSPSNVWLATIALVVTTILWGSTFILTKNITQSMPVFFYMGFRFLFSALAFLPYVRRFKTFTKHHFKISLGGALLYFLSLAAQTYGLQYTTASKAGFLTGLGVILVPIFLAMFYKKKIQKKIWFGCIFALIGIYILSFTGVESYSIGDPLILICAVFYAFYIIFMDKHVKEIDPVLFSAAQLFLMALISFGTSFLVEDMGNLLRYELITILSLPNLLILIYLGVIATSLTFLFTIYGQNNLPPTRVALIFALEPVFATIFGYFIGGELLSRQFLIGSILIFLGILISIENQRKKESKARE
jgi:drug/metabolite transporter (DMT)-like permease